MQAHHLQYGLLVNISMSSQVKNVQSQFSNRICFMYVNTYPIQRKIFPRSLVKRLLDRPCLTSLFQAIASSIFYKDKKIDLI